MSLTTRDALVAFRRDLHQYPEPAWREFYTTSRIVDELERIGVDELYLGRDALKSEARMAVPDAEEIESWRERARKKGAREDVLAAAEGGHTGAVAVLKKGEGPTVALRVDIDALPQKESERSEHLPTAEGFRSDNEGHMHACGHDAHATIGLGILERVKESDFAGTFKILFQPAEEVVGGGKAMAESGHLDDVDHMLALHVGLDYPTGEVVAGIDGFLAVAQLHAEFTGHPGHAGAKPEEGRNAVQAMAAAVQGLYGIPRHSDGATRVNAGRVEGGTASNIIPESATMEIEVRGETTELKEFVHERAMDALEGSAQAYGCEVDVNVVGDAPSATSDESLVDLVAEAAGTVDSVESLVRRGDLGGSEDATYLMQYVQDNGGDACYVCIGTSHPGGHHTATFDVEEETIPIGIDTLVGTIERLG
ncbi:amidohydrolase [Halosegnis longus]|uniref:Amidohydrolase n=1 Tax=Halosegnis longus TaxID=2216012 RepID=A0AAJ4R9F3_9EURY|nr:MULTISPECIES: amidohydrolase [Halobacteriales]RNJ26567.1 amidohydrolase [Salella cibi]